LWSAPFMEQFIVWLISSYVELMNSACLIPEHGADRSHCQEVTFANGSVTELS
jgi:hypothetical protein